MPTQEIINGMIDDLATLSNHSLEVNDFNSIYINDLTIKANDVWQAGLQEMYAQLLKYAHLQQEFVQSKTAHFFNGTQTDASWEKSIQDLQPLEAEFKVAAEKKLAELEKLKRKLNDFNDHTSDLKMGLRMMQLSIVQQKIDELKVEITKTLNDENEVITDFKQKAEAYVQLSKQHSALIAQAENAESFKISQLDFKTTSLINPALPEAEKLFTYQKPEGWTRWFRFLKEKLFRQEPKLSNGKTQASGAFRSVQDAWAKAKQNFSLMSNVFAEKAEAISTLVTNQRKLTEAELKNQKEKVLRPLQKDLQAFLTNWTGLSDDQVKQRVNDYLTTLTNNLKAIEARFHPDVQALLAKEFIEKFSDRKDRSLRNFFPTEAQFQAYAQVLSDKRFAEIMGEQYATAIAAADNAFQQEKANTQAKDARIMISTMSLDFSADRLLTLEKLPQLLQIVFKFGTRSDQRSAVTAAEKLKFTVIEPDAQTVLQLKLILRDEEKPVSLSKKVLQDSLKTLVKAQDFDARLTALRAHYLNVVFNGADTDKQWLADLQLGKFLEAPHKFTPNSDGYAEQENSSPNASYNPIKMVM